MRPHGIVQRVTVLYNRNTRRNLLQSLADTELRKHFVDHRFAGAFAGEFEQRVNGAVGADVDRVERDSAIERGARLLYAVERTHTAVALAFARQRGGRRIEIRSTEQIGQHFFQFAAALSRLCGKLDICAEAALYIIRVADKAEVALIDDR